MNLIRYNTPSSARSSALDHWFGHHPVARSFEGFDRLFGLSQGLSAGKSSGESSDIAADLYEDEDHYFARVELPGVKKDQLDLSLEDSRLSIGYHQNSADHGQKESVACQRSFAVPDGIAADQVSAKLEDGVLTVTLPKAEDRKPRSIKVK
jgi:HSP20 family protein